MPLNQNLPQIKQNIVILGGGTAGWITANLMAKHWLQLGIKVTLVESSDIGIIGVGEGSTPQMLTFFNEIEVDESEWMPACNATYKNGIRFVNWSKKPGYKSYFHPFASKIDAFTAPIFMQNCVARLKGYDVHAHPDRYYLATKLADEKLSPIASENFPFEIGYGYHFDAVLLGKFLRKIALKRGVQHVEGTVNQVAQHPNGDVKEVTLENGQTIAADLFVDCSGFRALLIGKTLKVPFISYKENLFNDRAITLPTPVSENINTATISTAMKCGWAWDIPLLNRTGNGYVYSSDFCTDDQAEFELREKLGMLESDTLARNIKMRVGRMEKHWASNVLAVGLSQGFIEPLEATALHFVLETVNGFIRSYGAGGFTRKNQAGFNQNLNARFEGIRDYIVAHYRLNSRTDSDYWNANGNNNKISTTLVQMINCWTSGGNLTQEIASKRIASYYPPFSWHCLLAGYGVFPAGKQLVKDESQSQRYDLNEIDEFIRRASLNFKAYK
ncbi:MAG: glycine/D-amino acid oxidase-like deaminating enzyme [Paraglaciecola sp.]|jgi:glycine/D-amino acid oxidase-like deaminating enzyme